ncbi:MAG: PAS domain S-box protein, partial [Gallionella sp.]|nr:PAS domain S-box protein [Gallionella sp.]
AQHSTAQHSTAQHSTAQHSTAQHSTAQHSTAQHSTAQHSTAQHSTEELLLDLQMYKAKLEMQNEELRLTQLALQESHDRYVELYDFAPIGYLILTCDGLIAKVNLAGAALLGEVRNNLIDRHFARFVAAKDSERWQRNFLHTLQHSGKLECELKLQRADGTVLHARLNGLNMQAEYEPAKVCIAFSDITGRIESELQYRTLADSSQALIWTSGTDKLCNYFNKTWIDFTGRTLEQELGNGWSEGIHPDDYQRCLEVYVSAFGRREKFSVDYRLRHHSGKYRWIKFDGSPRYDSEGVFIGYIGHCLDISIIKKSEQKQLNLVKALKRTAEEYSDLYQHAPCGYHSLDKNGVFLRINQTELEWLGYTQNEIVGKLNLADLLTPDTLPNFQRTFPQLKATGEVRDVELELIRKDGTVLPVLISATAIYGADGGYAKSRSTVYDITERKKMEQERNGYLRRQEEASRHLVAVQENARRRLSGELHDRTSPNLAAIDINLEIIATELPQEHSTDLAERLADTRALIVDTAASIREICSDLRPPLLDYAGLSAALEGYAQQFARRTGIAVQFDCADFNVRLAPDLESLLFRIFQEALTNCAKHARATQVEATLNHGSRPIALTIADNGVGFDPEQLGKGGHIGLGLLNMREMAEVAGGRFTIASDAGKGTRIAVEIS